MLKDLQALVECESPSSDLAACAKLLEVANQITAKVIGTSAEIIQESGRPVYWLGSKNPEVVLLTHLDTVWPIGSFAPLWRVDGDIASGPGVFDMKSGFIQALYAMRGQDLGRVALIATTDEETGSATSRKLIEEVSKKAKAVLVMEASLDGKLKIGRKGTSMYQITIHGRAAHAGLEPEKGINATVNSYATDKDSQDLKMMEISQQYIPKSLMGLAHLAAEPMQIMSTYWSPTLSPAQI